jgi:hypothetical protein
MPDLLVNLLRLPALNPLLEVLRRFDVNIRRAKPFELTPVRKFIENYFSVVEISVGLANKPVTVYIATRDARTITKT